LTLPLRTWLRLKRFQAAELFGFGARGWFIPYRYRASVQEPRAPYPDAPFKRAEPVMANLLAAVAGFGDAFQAFAGRPEPPTPRFDQDWFTGLDAAFLYTIIRTMGPRRIVEAGSGHSTRFAARAVLDGKIAASILAIDPAPRAAIGALAPLVELRREMVQETDPAVFDALQAGDILFIDSSHILMPGSDVDMLFNRVLPRLKHGVLVHIHDIFLPDPYPPAWAWRGYNEQNAAAALILGGAFEVLASSRYAETRMTEAAGRALAALPPRPATAFASSLWLRRAG